MKNKTKVLIIGILIILLILIAFLVYWIIYLNVAHSIFDDYYKFRGCNELINKTNDYGFCKLSYGETIKIVKFHDKWYLDGDLPVSCGIIECP